ncbi:hypothetical protein [Streptomyces sp. URMC 124]|uniref:hypothetical protein n=1 Tax=Streptomyces sp. URMC 124 TaxID=3423405 RepID=UPI003F1B6C89
MPRSTCPATGSAAPRAASRRRPLRALVALAALAAVTGAAGCSSAGEPVGAGRTAPASAPSRLWPQATPAPSPSGPQHDGETATKVPGVAPVPSGDIHEVDAYAAVRAEVRAARNSVTGADALDDATAAKVASSCSAGEQRNCPIRKPVYCDLTGDGHEDLVVGIEMEDHFLSLRAYTLVKGELTRVLSTVAQPSSIEVAGRDLIVWEPWTTPHYALRSVYTWNAQNHYMDFRRYEIRRAESSAAPAVPRDRERRR